MSSDQAQSASLPTEQRQRHLSPTALPPTDQCMFCTALTASILVFCVFDLSLTVSNKKQSFNCECLFLSARSDRLFYQETEKRRKEICVGLCVFVQKIYAILQDFFHIKKETKQNKKTLLF